MRGLILSNRLDCSTPEHSNSKHASFSSIHHERPLIEVDVGLLHGSHFARIHGPVERQKKDRLPLGFVLDRLKELTVMLDSDRFRFDRCLPRWREHRTESQDPLQLLLILAPFHGVAKHRLWASEPMEHV